MAAGLYDGVVGSSAPSQPRLLAIIELQNAIAAAAMNADEVMHIVADRAATLTSATAAIVALIEGDDLVHRAVIGSTSHDLGARVPKAASPVGRCLIDRRAVKIDSVAELGTELGAGPGGSSDTSSLACVPLLYGETAVGVLEILSPRAAAFTDEDVETLRVLGQIIAIALHRAYTYPRPLYVSLQDALTGLGNRRAFDERLDAELNRNRRFGHSFSLAMVKLDGLEAATDRLGQAAGDEMLRRLAAILKQHTRTIDGCFRVRADEFAIVMPGTSLDGARIAAERCRVHSIESRVCDSAVRLGFGVIEAKMEDSAGEITARANAALAYR
jgi:diguanylate cyclase (GGDEF)-like protein